MLPHRHDLDGILALVVPIRRLTSHSSNLGDTRILFGDKMCREFSSNVREASIYPPIQQQMRSAVQCIGCALWGEVLGQAAINVGPNISPCKQNMFHEMRPDEPSRYGHRRVKYHSCPYRLNKSKCLNSLRRFSIFYSHPKHDTSALKHLPSVEPYFSGHGWK